MIIIIFTIFVVFNFTTKAEKCIHHLNIYMTAFLISDNEKLVVNLNCSLGSLLHWIKSKSRFNHGKVNHYLFSLPEFGSHRSRMMALGKSFTLYHHSLEDGILLDWEAYSSVSLYRANKKID